MVPIIEEAALRSLVTPARAVAAIREAFRADGDGRTRVPPVINLEMPAEHGEFHVKTASIDGLPHVAVKVASGFYDNPRRGLPSGSGLMAVFDAHTGFPAALLLDNGLLTDLRTGAAGAVAADLLARRDIETVGVIGSGQQARHQIRCLQTVRSFRRVVAWSPTRARLDRYCAEMRDEGFEVDAVAGPEAVCAAADLVITATPARTPLVRGGWLREGMHITAVGADAPGKQELGSDCFARASLVVTDRDEQCAAFGDLRHALDAGILTRAGIHAELGAIVTGRAPGRTAAHQITLVDLTGVGFQDTAIASLALRLSQGSPG